MNGEHFFLSEMLKKSTCIVFNVFFLCEFAYTFHLFHPQDQLHTNKLAIFATIKIHKELIKMNMMQYENVISQIHYIF